MKLGIVKFLKKIKNNNTLRAKKSYTTFYEENLPLESAVLLESYHGKQIASNEFYFLKELRSRDLSRLNIFVTAEKRQLQNVKNRLKEYNLNFANVVEKDSDEYCRLLCTSKYLINSTTFPDYFIKREGQVYLNTWHGTPLKNMGKKDRLAPQAIANVQRNLLMSDYILFPNNHTKEVFHEDYMLDKLYSGSYIIGGYPRNQVFYDAQRRVELREKLNLSNKRVIAYMPTWRGMLGKISNQKSIAYTYVMIDKLSRSLEENEVLYVNLHYLMSQNINLDGFENVKTFPSDLETYDFLNTVDVLITDYSSVMFDFANSGREIILYTYDKSDYEQHRGTYLDLDDFPFAQASTEAELIEKIHTKSDYDYTSFVDTFCSCDHRANAKNILDLLFHGRVDESLEVIENFPSKKEKVLIYAGNLAKNGITTSLKSLISQLNLDEKEYCLTFASSAVRKHVDEVHYFADKLSYIPYRGMVNFTLLEAIFLFVYHKLNISNATINRVMDHIYKREINRIYPNLKFDKIIQFNGYDRQNINLLARFESEKAIYVHNDMWREYQERKICHKPTMDYAYKNYDRLAIVTQQLKESLVNFECNFDNIRVVENVHDHQSIVEKSKLPLAFDNDTFCNVEFEQVNKALHDDSLIKFVNIARFSPEKGHDRLIRAFEKVYDQNEHVRLIIIGGHGKLFEHTLNQAQQSRASEAIIIIRSMSNPFTVLKHCNLFVFSSVYEGLGLVMLEALSLGVPVVSTDIPGPRDFLNKGYGILLPDSEDGIFQGMQMYLDGKIKDVDIDWDDYNQQAISQFENLFK